MSIVISGALTKTVADGKYEPVSSISVANSSGDVAAITAAITAGTSGGIVNGKWQTRTGQVARITTPTTIALGYTGTTSADQTSATPQKVRLSLDILPDAGLGAALTITGGYGVELDLNVLGGGARGTVTDAATTVRTGSADGTISAGATAFTSASLAFTNADVNATIAIPGAGAGGLTLFTKILTVVDSANVTISSAAQTSVTTAAAQVGSLTVSSPAAVAAGLRPGAVVFILGAGPAPEGQPQPLAASVRTVDVAGGTFTLSEGAQVALTGATMNWFDVAVRLENHFGLKLNVYAKSYQGCVIAADAADNTGKRIRASEFGRVNSSQVGMTWFWKGIEAQGTLGEWWSTPIYGDYFGLCADMNWIHAEVGVGLPPTQLARTYVWFDRCTAVNNLSISVGDRATEAAVLITGDSAGSQSDIGRFSMLRCTLYIATATGTITSGSNQITGVVTTALTMKVGQTIVGPGIPDGTTLIAVSGTGNGYTAGSPGTLTMSTTATATTSGAALNSLTCDGVKMIGVSSATVVLLDTAKCVAGLRVVGGGGNGIRVLHHKSLTSDLSPLVIQPGTTGLNPRVDVHADWRYVLGYVLDVKAGLGSSTDIRLRGYSETMQIASGATGRYAARCASSTVKIDLTDHHQLLRSGLLGFIDTTTAVVLGRERARLDNEIQSVNTVYLTDGAGGFKPVVYAAAGALAVGTTQTVLTNTVTETVVAGPYTIPASSVVAGTTLRLRAWGTTDNDASATVTMRLRVGGVTGTSIAAPVAITSGTAKTQQAWNAEWIVQVRSNASAATPLSVGGYAFNATSGTNVAQGLAATNVNMTVARDLVVGATWSAATTTNVFRCEGYTIEQIK